MSKHHVTIILEVDAGKRSTDDTERLVKDALERGGRVVGPWSWQERVLADVLVTEV